MKLNLLLLLLISLVMSSYARPIFSTQESSQGNSLRNTDFREVVEGFFQGVKIEQYTSISDECADGSFDFTNEVQVALDKYGSGQFYNGTDEMTQAFTLLSPLSRHCAASIEDLIKINIAYKKKFKNFNDFLDKVSSNVLWNIKHIKKDFGLILSNLMVDSNYTEIAYLTGDIIDKTFVFEQVEAPFDTEMLISPYESPLRYIDTDPLAKDPLHQPLWNYLEGTFKFLHSSKLASRDSILDCQEGAINFLRYVNKANELNHKKNKQKEATFIYIDSLSFTNQAFTGCVSTLDESWKTLGHISFRKIPSNFKKNFGRILSAGTATYAEIFFQDWLSLSGVIGDLFYRIVVYGTN